MHTNRFDPLLKHVETKEEAAARLYAERLKALTESESRLRELARYADEYANPNCGPSNAALLLNHQRFRERIEAALDQQRKVVERTRSNFNLQHARLMLASRDSKAMEQLAASHRVRLARDEARREQTQLDDLAGRQHREKKTRSEP